MKNEKLSTQIYNKIKNDLLYLKILPGTVLQEREIANIFSVSRTPIREAIQRLAIEGWVKINSRSSIVVKCIYKKDVIEIFQIRRIIEPMILDIILEKRLADTEFVEKIQTILNAMKSAKKDRAKFIYLDQKFHSTIVYKLNNSKLNQTWEQVGYEIVRLGMFAMQKIGRFNNVIKEHQKIVDALVDMNKQEAKKSSLYHINVTENIIIEGIFKEEGNEIE